MSLRACNKCGQRDIDDAHVCEPDMLRLKSLEEHHVRQIDENRKISKRVDEFDQKIKELHRLHLKRMEENTLISRRLTQIEITLKVYPDNEEFPTLYEEPNKKYCSECGKKND